MWTSVSGIMYDAPPTRTVERLDAWHLPTHACIRSMYAQSEVSVNLNGEHSDCRVQHLWQQLVLPVASYGCEIWGA